MKRINKRWAGLILMTVLAVTMTIAAYGADTKIERVNVEFSYETAPKSGESVGTVTAKTSSSKFHIDSAEYTNDTETWNIGDRPVVKVRMTASGGYRFYYTSQRYFSLSGGKAEFKKARIYDGGDSMELEVYLKQVGGKLNEVDGLEWDGTIARWNRMDGAQSYEAVLYRGSRQVMFMKVSGRSYNFSDNLTREGSYRFRVRAIAEYNGSAGEWSEYSDEYYVDEEEARNHEGNGRWVQDQKGWWYTYSGGGYPVDCWKKINNAWYYFNRDGYMATGWQKLDGNWYYLDFDGKMLTGWRYINGRWYYLDGSGAMTAGWRYINGRWYYLEGSGAMLTGWQLINGRWYYLEGSGAMLTGWQLINGRWYYLEGSGAMLTGWQLINGSWYYLEGSGAMLTGWQYINGHWYYLSGNGAMLTGWQHINGRWYYLGSNGAMYANSRTPDGRYVDASGARVD